MKNFNFYIILYKILQLLNIFETKIIFIKEYLFVIYMIKKKSYLIFIIILM